MRFPNLRNPFVRPDAPASAPPALLRQADPPFAAATPLSQRWTAERIAVADELWGDGFLLPGGEQEVLHLTVPLGVSEASSLLLLGAAAGGAVRAVAAGLGAWISGHEADPALAAAAAWRLPRAGMAVARRATVVPWNPTAPEFRRRGFDHALALEALRGGPGHPVPVAELLLALAGALRPGGHLVLVDLVATARLDPADEAVRRWAEVEGRTAALPSEAGLTAALGELSFDVRVAEDISARHMRLAVQGWKGLVQKLADVRPERARAQAVVAEAEVWTRRLGLVHSGQVRLMRWDAIGG